MKPTMPRQGLWTPQQCAEFLNVTPRRLQHWRSTGTGPAFIKLGNDVRYAPGHVIAWTQRQQVTPGGNP